MQRLITYRTMVDLRDPDAFQMYTFNDHAGYGAVEVAQNMLLDFQEASGNWKEQWAICEGLALLRGANSLDPMIGIDDGELFRETSIMLELMLLTALAELEKQGQLGANSDVRNLGMVMGLFAKEAQALRSDGYIDDEPSTTNKTYSGEHFVPYLLAYANKHNIPIHGPSEIDEIIAEAEEEAEEADVQLPTAKDPWKWATAFKAYERKNKGSTTRSGKAVIGGDSLDITTFSSAERKANSFDGKDPLSAKEIKSIKDGMCLCLG
ncbi:uncharacterized protein BO97DRAFT_378712 [Aspergillus homomorphus CBS 101889]|uniref:Uncharacterized protein n=1 Tax=Aspergillus homomorphus (strain CBS 101889) TaxID=1450537 RepID=A0A395HHQ8_ASPHC|nr:hypothetical protein BO97DRAFT_378712 [Aspergillus homomorphus CBS 101889]RAL07347.1 hypothetical protein BO97DRAFT_378712 [Aspergillus homomorphus CBS 101889]